MKRLFYSIFALSTMLFMASSCSEDRGTTTEVASSNEDENVNPNNLRGYGDREPGGAPPANPEAGQMYGFEVDKYSDAFAKDLNLDADLATEMVKIYYDRNRQLSELEQRYQYSETSRMGGQAAEETDNAKTKEPPMTEAQKKAEQERIDQETDQKVKEVLNPEQYKTYEMNRSKYHQMQLEKTGKNQ
ncbi:hypothetical protein ACSX1A_14115 [Pontibacter sp. MBLB2868]|uniref:hypothetical protein n=1 Tax=Pontibacter sp. MBLB2868 TaxID=3451555 RepID=UPI003F74ADDB